MVKSCGKQTVLLDNATITSSAAVVGKKEGEGPLGSTFDFCYNDSLFGQETFEQAESQLQFEALERALRKTNLQAGDISFVFAGDLLNQCTGSSFGLKDFNIPFLGVYGACSTCALSIGCAAVFCESGAASNMAAVTSSHFCSSERQYRFPLEYGSLRTPSSQWTVTGAGAFILQNGGNGARIRSVTFGKIADLGIKDANNMGAAMAPAAAETIKQYFSDTNTVPNDFDCIFTGDLGAVGTTLLYELLQKEGIDISSNHKDCGLLIFDRKTQNVNAGGSGAGCCASVLAGHILSKIKAGSLKNILFCATGALLSPTSCQQGQNIISVAHLLNITA